MDSNSKRKILGKTDIENILKLYNLGYFKSSRQKIRYTEGLQPIYIIKTSEGKFLLKQYFKFDYFRRNGLSLIRFLLRRKYPCIKVFNSKKAKPYVKYKGITFAVFEFVEPEHRWNLSKNTAYEMGKYLGRLHTLARNFPIRKITDYNYDSFLDTLRKNYYKTRNAPERFRKIFKYINNNFEKLRVPSNLPKSICHEEFFPPHVRFRGQKLVKVIDWDEVNRNYMFYDLGTCTVSAFYSLNLNFELLANIIKAYNNERKLTTWEKDHIFKAVQFGTSKFSIWSLEGEKTGRWSWNSNYARTLNLMKYDEIEFNEKLSKFIKL